MRNRCGGAGLGSDVWTQEEESCWSEAQIRFLHKSLKQPKERQRERDMSVCLCLYVSLSLSACSDKVMLN